MTIVRPRLRVLLLAALVAGLVVAGAVAAILRHGDREPQWLDRLLELGAPIYCGGGTKPYVALTFDDGPTRRTGELLEVLRENEARATFFEIGRNAAASPHLVREEAAAGAVGDHSWSHPTLTGLGRDRVRDELDRTRKAIERASGQRVVLFRPPFGAHDVLVDDVARSLGLLQVLWNVDSGDASEASTPSSAKLAENLAERVRPGAIVLLHEDETVPVAIGALRTFLPELRRRGLKAVSVPELLRLDPPTPAAIENGPRGCTSTWRP